MVLRLIHDCPSAVVLNVHEAENLPLIVQDEERMCEV